MKQRFENRSRQGFTLMEILIVVAVIAILVAIAIPVFSAQLDKARAGVCAANRRSLLSVCYADCTAAGDVSEDALKAAFTAHMESAYGKATYVCPSGGRFSWKSGAGGYGHIECDKHGEDTSGYTLSAPLAEVAGDTTAVRRGTVYRYNGVDYMGTNDYGGSAKIDTLLAWGSLVPILGADTPYTSAAYNAAADRSTYAKGSVCEHNGSLYVKLKRSTSKINDPVDASTWALLGKVN